MYKELLCFIVRSHLTLKRRSVLYFPLFSRVKGDNGSPVLPRLLVGIVGGRLPRRAYFESLRAAEAKNAATINQLKYRSHSFYRKYSTRGVVSGK